MKAILHQKIYYSKHIKKNLPPNFVTFPVTVNIYIEAFFLAFFIKMLYIYNLFKSFFCGSVDCVVFIYEIYI